MNNLINRYKKIPIAAKASIWYTICNILQKGISFIVIPIYTRILSTTEYGAYSVFQSWRDIIIIFATLNLYCGVFTKAMVDYADDRDRYTSSMQGLSSVITLIIFSVYVIGNSYWNNLFSMNSTTMILMFLYFLTHPSFAFWSVRQRVEYKYVKMVVVTIVSSLITPIVSLLLLFNTDLREHAVIWGFLICQILFGLFFYVLIFTKNHCFYNKKYWIHALKFNIPLIPHYLSLIVLGQADRIMISEYCGNDKAAIYSLAYQVSMVMNIVISAINNSLVPWIYEKLKKKDYRNIYQTTKSIGLVIVIMSFFAMLSAPEIVLFLGTEEYLSAIWVIPSVATSVYFTFCYGLFSDVEFYYGSTKYVMVASTCGAFLNVFLNWLFIPTFGFIAAGYTTLFCYFVFMIMHFVFMKITCRKNECQEKIFDIRFISVSCMLLCMLAGVCMLLYNFNYLRYITALTTIIITIVFRKKIVLIIKSIKKK